MFDARKLLNQILGGGAAAGGAGGDPLSEVGGLVGAVFGQAFDGLREGAAEIEGKTGVGARANAALREASGRSAREIIDDVKGVAERNKLATGAALAGVGALLLGTRSGRGLARNAAAMGGLALIGGLAYKAWKNHEAGKPLIDRSGAAEPAPAASPFGETGDDARDQATAALMLRAMIAAAASDGMIDNEERSRIIGALEAGGLDAAAARFLDEEFARPASIGDLAAAATTRELRLQVYAAAHMALEADKAVEKEFLVALAVELGLTPEEVREIEAQVSGARSA